MIDRNEFSRVWRKLEDRFGKQTKGTAADYLAYLDPLLDADEFVEAARAVWASREFFPRPADFLVVRQGSDWAKLQAVLNVVNARGTWTEAFESMSEAGQRSVKALGGVFLVADRMQRNPGMIRKDFGTEYEQAVQTLTIETALPPGDTLPEVTAASRAAVQDACKGARLLTEGDG